jgi:hypothetical protein
MSVGIFDFSLDPGGEYLIMGTDEEMIRCIEIYDDENGSDEANLFSESELQFFEKNKLNADDWDHVCPHCQRKMDYYYLKRRPRELDLDRPPGEEMDIPLEPEAMPQVEQPTPAAEVPVEATPAEEPTVEEEAPAEETPEEAPVEEAPAEEIPAEEEQPPEEEAEEEAPPEEPKPKKKAKKKAKKTKKPIGSSDLKSSKKKVKKKKAKKRDEEPEPERAPLGPVVADEEEPEPEEEAPAEEEPPAEETPPEKEQEEDTDELDHMTRSELKNFIKEWELDLKVLKKDSDEDVRNNIRVVFAEKYGDDDEEEEDEDE